jgi:hypothetical protein
VYFASTVFVCMYLCMIFSGKYLGCVPVLLLAIGIVDLVY